MVSPRVAVIVPCFRDGATLPEAVHSVREDEPVELVVVDDGSKDPVTLAALDRLEAEGVRVLRKPENGGLVEARMTGLETTRAPYVLPLDSDDSLAENVLGPMADLLDSHPEAVACVGDYEEFGTGHVVRAVPDRLDPYRLAYTNEYPVTALFRRDRIEALNGWRHDGANGTYEDWDLWLKLAGAGGSIVHLGPGVVTYRRRLHESRSDRALDLQKRRHASSYATLRQAHPDIFGRLAEHRRQSDLSFVRKLAYPVVYGGRPPLPFEPTLKRWLDRLGIWTLRR